jgi:hypothetical protein
MNYTALRPIPDFMPEALFSSQVGTWKTDFDRDRAACDATTAALFGLATAAAASGLPISAFVRAIHPEDRATYLARTQRMRENGGLYVVEYRTMPRPGDVRWILVRGHYERDPVSGSVLGRGIVIDITESKLDGLVEDKAYFLAPETPDVETPLDRAATHAIEAREAIDAYAGPEAAILRRAINAVLWIVGCTLARQQKDPVL